MFVKIIERQDSTDENLTILMTLTSTLTVSSLPASLIPTMSTTPKSRSTASVLTKTITSTSKFEKATRMLQRPKTLLSIPTALVSKISAKPEVTSDLVRSTQTTEPLHSSFNNISGVAKDNGLLKLGLAVGIPIAFISILVGIILTWYYLKKKTFHKRRQGLLPYKGGCLDHNDEENLTMNETKMTLSINLGSTASQLRSGTPLQIHIGPNQQIRNSSVKNFINRLSRTVNIRNIYDNDMETLSENKSGLMSPIFLKKFNLRKSVCRPSEVYNSEERLRRTNGLLRSVDADFLSIPYNNSKLSLTEKRYKKPLPKLPPIIDTYKSKSLYDMENVVTQVPLPSTSVDNGNFDIYKVIRPYIKNLDDEISIKLGDKVRILKEHSDGWCFIKIIRGTEDSKRTNSNQGIIPRLCLQKIDQ